LLKIKNIFSVISVGSVVKTDILRDHHYLKDVIFPAGVFPSLSPLFPEPAGALPILSGIESTLFGLQPVLNAVNLRKTDYTRRQPRRRPGSRIVVTTWIPAFAGMTNLGSGNRRKGLS
jgi:hypothetical protein